MVQIYALGKSLEAVCRSLEKNPSSAFVSQALDITSQMEKRARDMVAVQEHQLVPYVAAYIPSSQQKRFNNKVREQEGWGKYQ